MHHCIHYALVHVVCQVQERAALWSDNAGLVLRQGWADRLTLSPPPPPPSPSSWTWTKHVLGEWIRASEGATFRASKCIQRPTARRVGRC